LKRRVLLPLCAAALLAVPLPGLANGRFPNAQYVWASPRGDGLVLRATWGLALLDDGAAPQWACEEALGYGGEFDPALVIDRAGGVWLGLYDGLARIAPDRCGVTRVTALAGANVVDLDASPDGTTLVAVDNTPFVSSGQAITAHVWRSDDAGTTWLRGAATLDEVLVDTVEMARSDRQRLYLTARDARSPAIRVYRSDDGGASLVALPVPWADEAEAAYVAGIDPRNADRVYLRVVLRPAAAGGLLDATALYRSDDAGVSWRRVLQTRGPMLGFAYHDDGLTLWAGGPDSQDGLQRSLDRGDSWQRMSTTAVRCLRWARGGLYACRDGARRGAALARSDDGGATFVDRFDPCTLRPGLGCRGGDDPGALCASVFASTRALLGCTTSPSPDAGVAPDADVARDAGPIPGDDGVPAEASSLRASASAGGCRTAPGGRARPWFVLLGLLMVRWVQFLRRRP